jgi:hypothetical protein
MGYMGRQDRFSHRFIGALIDEITTSMTDRNSERTRLAHVVEVALRGINSAEYRIASGLQTIESRARMIDEKLNNGYRLNELGEFQSAPVEVDQAIVTRQAFYDVLAVALTEGQLERVMAEAKRFAKPRTTPTPDAQVVSPSRRRRLTP